MPCRFQFNSVFLLRELACYLAVLHLTAAERLIFTAAVIVGEEVHFLVELFQGFHSYSTTLTLVIEAEAERSLMYVPAACPDAPFPPLWSGMARIGP